MTADQIAWKRIIPKNSTIVPTLMPFPTAVELVGVGVSVLSAVARAVTVI